MSNNSLIGPWVRRFLMEHLVGERNLARNTQTSYRDMLTLLLPFAAKQLKKSVDRLHVDDISATIVRNFLIYLEQERGCCVVTRNQRLAGIHALARFIGTYCPEYIVWCTQIRTIPFKKSINQQVTYLERHELDALLNAPDQNTMQGVRDYALLAFLFNTGTRANEAAELTISDLELGEPPSVRILGKGNKVRCCPLWSSTAKKLLPLIDGRKQSEPVFLNRCRRPITRFGIYALVKRCAAKAGRKVHSLRKKVVSPHTIRHSTAVFLLRSGVDINTIRAWLGHVSVDTTNIYAEVDLDMKAKALAHCANQAISNSTHREWHQNKKLMTFLKAL